MAFQIHQEERGGALVLRVTGDVDLNNAPELLRALRSAFKAGQTEVVVDLARVEHLDSSGIAVLVEGVKHSRRTGVGFALASVSPHVRSVIELAKLGDFFDYHRDEDDGQA